MFLLIQLGALGVVALMVMGLYGKLDEISKRINALLQIAADQKNSSMPVTPADAVTEIAPAHPSAEG